MPKTITKEIIEKLAELEHEQWSRWVKYMIYAYGPENIKKWQKQAETKYNDLSEKEKESDREYAIKVLELLKKFD